MNKVSILIAAICLMLFNSVAVARPLTPFEIQEGTVRVHAGSAYGTGTCYMMDSTYIYVLTNAHVVGQNQTVYVEAFRAGYKTKEIPAVVQNKWMQERTDVDFAILRVNKSHFGQYLPRIISLIPREYKATRGTYIYSAGCPSAMWPLSWQGRVQLDQQSRYLFLPAPVGGQSGSGIFVMTKEGRNYETKLAAIVTWRIGTKRSEGVDDAVGGAIPINTFYGVVEGTYRARLVPLHYRQVAHFDRVERGPCPKCGYPESQHAMGSNGSLYCIHKVDSCGRKYYVHPTNIPIVDFGPHTFRQPGIITHPLMPIERLPINKKETIPYYPKNPVLGGWPFSSQDWYRGRPYPYSNDRRWDDYMVPCPPEGCPPYQRGDPYPYGNDEGNPYGVNPPDVPWGNEPVPPNDDVAPDLTPPIPAPLDPNNSPSGPFGWFRFSREKWDVNFFQAIGIASLAGLLVIVYRKAKPYLLSVVDKWQDKTQRYVATKFGDEVATEIRDIMEGVEEFLVGIADRVAQENESAKTAVRTRYKTAVRNKLGLINKSRLSPIDIQALVEQLANDPEDSTISPEAAVKIRELAAAMEREKVVKTA